MERPKSVIFLVIWFLWAAGKDLDLLARFPVKVDYYIFSANGLIPLFFVVAASVFLANSATVYYLFRPSRAGYYTALAALILAVVQNAVTLFLALRDLPGAREAYAIGREIRGLAVREETLDTLFTPGAMQMTLAGVLVFYFLMGFVLIRNRAYFRAKELPA